MPDNTIGKHYLKTTSMAEEHMAEILKELLDPGTSVDSGKGRLQLNILIEGDDIEAYLTTFERLVLGYSVEKKRWSYRLAPNLTGKP